MANVFWCSINDEYGSLGDERRVVVDADIEVGPGVVRSPEALLRDEPVSEAMQLVTACVLLFGAADDTAVALPRT